MTKRVKATVAPAVLIWARASAGYQPDEAAAKLDVDPDKLAAWEAGEDQPSIPQLRKLAALYKRPLAVLYLAEPPTAFQPMHDFRRVPDHGPLRFSPGLTLEIRNAQQRRALALELFEENQAKPTAFTLAANDKADPEVIGAQIREALGVTADLQSHWGNQLAAFREWRGRIEDRGVLVFQASRVDSDEASGFAVWADPFPIVVVNRKDAYPRRIFSLLHELTHLMIRQSGVSELNVDAPRAAADARIEVFCNQSAAAALMPRALFLGSPLIAPRGPGPHDWPDDVIASLANTFNASREAVVRRLSTFDRATPQFYANKRAQYAAEYQAERAKVKADAAAGDGIPRNMPRETIANYGRTFVRAVIENYHQDRLTLSEVSGYLGVKVRHIPVIESQMALA
jgi:Zn-dependent peptidase ImmA (M78 family)/transcriptional regulator with XRE-family HTH domain